MHPFSGAFEPDFQGATTAASPVGAMQAGRVDSFDGGQAGSFQPFVPNRPHRQLATSDSTGTNSYSSQLSLPYNSLSMDNLKVCIFPQIIHHSINAFIQNLKATSTPPSSFESGWSNFQAEGRSIPIEQYRSLQARHNEMHREYLNLMKEHLRLEAKNSALKYVLKL